MARVALRGSRSNRSMVEALMASIFWRIGSARCKCPLRSRAGSRIGNSARRRLPHTPVGGLPEHDQCGPHCLVIQRGAYTSLPSLDGRLGVQRSNRRLLVIAGHRDELIEDLALLSAGSGAVASPDCVGVFGPRLVCHLGAHSPSEVVETPWWAGAVAGNISAEATTPTGNTFAEAMRGACQLGVDAPDF